MELFKLLSVKGLNFPNIGWIDMTETFSVAKIFDNHTSKAHFDVIFKSAFHGTEGIQRTGLNRGEFYELLTRLAIHKYLSLGIAKTSSEAVEMLLDVLKTNLKMPKLQEWRTNELWTLDVNDCFTANFENLKYIYGVYLNKKTPAMTYEIA
jgi:hypothetical protein